ncbi:MAG TPA: peptidoglycan -binding protein [Geminicoccaceae bacterium]|nr:peptidoglycan -binding protein [Geminicoccaceae bacterium]
MARSRRELRHIDQWPGYVDALSTLLLAITFLLVVFVLSQFFLNQLLQGKDTKLKSLESSISQLTAQLDTEHATNSQLRLSVAKLSADLQGAQADRDDAMGRLGQTSAERDQFRDQLAVLQDQKAQLTQTLNELRVEADKSQKLQADLERSTDLRSKLAEELRLAQQNVTADKATIEAQLSQLIQLRRDIDALQKTRHELDLQVAEMTALLKAAEQAKGDATKEIARLADLLEAVQAKTKGLETEVAKLNQSVAESGQKNQDLSSQIARLTALLDTARGEKTAADQRVAALSQQIESARGEGGKLSDEVARLQELLKTAEQDKATREARVAELSSQLQAAGGDAAERERRLAELSALLREEQSKSQQSSASAEELQKAREQLLAQLGQVRDQSSELESKLASAQERTMLAQKEIDQRDTRIADLLRQAGRKEEALATEQALSRESLNQVETLNRQINALRVQLASLQQALDVSKQKAEEQQVTITDLGSKLNMALAGKVEELGRFRSEFFGRLRQLLGDRPDVRIVGDRFVFQSEVLFPSASADIEPSGQDELRKLADSLRQISSEIPSDLPWVLQINGHTDTRPISTPEFPSNWELSTERAINVGKFLISQGIPPERIAVAGFASFQPLDDRHDEIAYRRNRRIELKLTTP